MAQSQPPSYQLARSLLELPDKALLAVLRFLAPEYGHIDLFSAARTCSELQQLSTEALTSISATVTQQHQVASLRLYLARHSRHVKSLCLYGADEGLLGALPPGLKLDRLSLSHLRLQLLRVGSSARLLPLGTSVKQLEINYCDVCDHSPDAALAKALSQLPQLEHITYRSAKVAFPATWLDVLPRLQQLTSLHVIDAPADIVGFVHLTPGLRDLKACLTWSSTSTSTKLSALHHLTSLCLEPAPCFEGAQFSPAGLANKWHLQRLQLEGITAAGGPAGVAVLMFLLQQMTQLTHLALPGCWDLGADDDPSRPPASMFSALTASSTLQHLDVSGNSMPQGVWQHVLPAGRQLPHLRVLQALNCGGLASWAHADTARLANCCPNLQELAMRTPEPVAADALQPLRDLAALTALEAGEFDNAGLAAAAGLTQLRRLRMWKQRSATDAGLLHLTQLRQLSILVSSWGDTVPVFAEVFGDKGCDGVPVWRQVLLHCLQSKQPGVAHLAHCACWQQAAASSEQHAQ